MTYGHEPATLPEDPEYSNTGRLVVRTTIYIALASSFLVCTCLAIILLVL